MRKIGFGILCQLYDPCNPRVQSIKKEKVFQELRSELLINVFDVLIGRMDDGRACMYNCICIYICMYIKHAYNLICQ